MSTSAVIIRSTAALLAAALVVAGCASHQGRVAARDPSWTKYTVAGSRIPRRLDSFGKPATGTLVQTISDDELKAMPGNSLSDKLSGNPGGF